MNLPPRFSPKTEPGRVACDSGFALIVALGLMAFILLLLLGLSTFARVESESARISKDREEARQNALLGLQVALGRLQMMTGPDQRATAPASALVEGNYYGGEAGVEGVEATKHWTGVWAPENYDPNRDASENSGRRFLGWLVSGENKDDLSAFETAPVTNSFGQEPALLVGDGSVQARAGQSVDGVKVRAEVEPILADSQPNGGFAYWVADESVKVKVDVRVPEQLRDTTAGSWENSVAAALAGEPALSRIGSSSSSGGPFTPMESLEPAEFARLFSLESVSLVDDEFDGEATPKEYFHDVSLRGAGLLVDAQNGGLRRDLTSLLGDAQNFHDTLYNERIFWFNEAPEIENLPDLTRDNLRHPYGLNWEYLFHYYVLPNNIENYGQSDERLVGMPRFQWQAGAANVGGSVSGPPSPLNWSDFNGSSFNYPWPPQNAFWNGGYYESTEDHNGESVPATAAVILRVQITYRLEAVRVNNGPDDLPNTADDSYRLRLHTQPAFVLYNPYNVTISLDRFPEYEYSNFLRIFGSPQFELQVRESDPGGPIKFTNQFKVGAISAQHMPRFNQDPVYGLHHFSHDVTYGQFNAVLDPGEVLIFSPDIDGGTIWMKDLVGEGGFAPLPMAKGFDPIESAYWDNIYIDLNGNGLFDDYPRPNSENGFLVNPLNAAYVEKVRSQVDFLPWPPAYDAGSAPDQDYLKRDDVIRVFVDFNRPPNHYGGTAGYSFGYAMWPFHPEHEIVQVLESPANFQSAYEDGIGDPFFLRVDNLVGSVPHYPIGALIVKIKPGSDNVDAVPGLAFDATLDPVRVLADHNFRVFRDSALTAPAVDGDLHTMYTSEFVVGDDAEMPHAPSQSDYGYWGAGLRVSEGTTHTTLFDIPRAPLVSLGQFQHVPLGVRSTEPSYVAGNSIKPPWMPGDKTLVAYSNDIYPNAVSFAQASEDRLQVDASYYVNDALFDEYFFSTVPTENLPSRFFFSGENFDQAYVDAGKRLPSARLRYLRDDGASPEIADLRDPEKAAANLFIDGAFNVNSASVEAWKGMLAGVSDLRLKGAGDSGTTDLIDYPVARLLQPYLDSSLDDEELFEEWNGVAGLNESQIEALAAAIVEEVKLRGPFLSLAQFINRNLIADAEDPGGTRYAGALQAALDATGLSNTSAGVNAEFEAHSTGFGDPGKDDSFARNAAQWISQADLLSLIAPALTVRADTFVIRCYGESRDPLTGEIKGTALGEAVVQRFPEYVDPADEAWKKPYPEASGRDSDGGPEFEINPDLLPENVRFGRRYRIISFRWLDAA